MSAWYVKLQDYPRTLDLSVYRYCHVHPLRPLPCICCRTPHTLWLGAHLSNVSYLPRPLSPLRSICQRSRYILCKHP